MYSIYAKKPDKSHVDRMLFQNSMYSIYTIRSTPRLRSIFSGFKILCTVFIRQRNSVIMSSILDLLRIDSAYIMLNHHR